MERNKIHLEVCNITGRKWDVEVEQSLLLFELKEMIADFVYYHPYEQRIVCYRKIDGKPFMLWSRDDHSSIEELGICDGDKIIVVFQGHSCSHK